MLNCFSCEKSFIFFLFVHFMLTEIEEVVQWAANAMDHKTGMEKNKAQVGEENVCQVMFVVILAFISQYLALSMAPGMIINFPVQKQYVNRYLMCIN